jgi:lysophospholipase L1-like esterase
MVLLIVMGHFNRKKTLFISATILISIVFAAYGVVYLINRSSEGDIVRVACVGDSITEGSNYPDYLWMLLGSKYKVGNFGVSSTTVSLQSNIPYINQPEFMEAKNFAPNVVVIMLGTNDAYPNNQQTKANFIKDYEALVKEFQVLPSAPQIWLVKPPPVFRNGTGISTEFFTVNIIPAIEAVAGKLNLQVIDLYEPLSAYPQYFSFDGVHPNEEGAHAIAQNIYQALVQPRN